MYIHYRDRDGKTTASIRFYDSKTQTKKDLVWLGECIDKEKGLFSRNGQTFRCMITPKHRGYIIWWPGSAAICRTEGECL